MLNVGFKEMDRDLFRVPRTKALQYGDFIGGTWQRFILLSIDVEKILSMSLQIAVRFSLHAPHVHY